MKKIFVFGLMILSIIGMAFAGNIEISDPTFEDGDHYYNGSAIIDADTLQGHQPGEFATISQVNSVSNYISTNEAKWSYDRSGIGTDDLSKKLIGNYDLFQRFETFMDYLMDIFAPKSEIARLEMRIDELEAKLYGIDYEDYAKSKAVEQGSYGDYSCYDGLCIKKVN